MDTLHKLSWDWIKSFVAVAEHGSVAVAAQHLQTNAATVSRQIVALEKHLGIELFVRSRQGMQATLPAMQFLAPAQAMHSAMHQLSLGAASKDEALQGLVRVSASMSLANYVLPDLLSVLRSQQPHIQFEVIATDAQSNLLKREADIAIRLMQPTQTELIAKRVANFGIGLYASQSYVARRGQPRLDPRQLMLHDFVDVSPQNQLRHGFAKVGMPHLSERIIAHCSDHSCSWQMVKSGLGIGSALGVVAQREPLVMPVLSDVVIERLPVWLVTHKELRQQPRLRLVYDYLATALKSLGETGPKAPHRAAGQGFSAASR